VPNICFHGVGTPQRELEPGESRYWVSRDDFLRILDELSGWESAGISFDDGNASDVEIGLPALLERGMTATFYPLAGRLDEPGSLGREDVRRLHGSGMGIGTHGWAHVPWTGLSGASLHREVVEARRVLAEAAGALVSSAALPLGRYDGAVLQRLRVGGYAGVASSDRTLAHDGSWWRPRFSARAGDTPESVLAEVQRAAQRSARLVASAKSVVKRMR
jgi:peptidoglycan/xylan/chitin deacetylase (PgdA/CDA1 family)